MNQDLYRESEAPEDDIQVLVESHYDSTSAEPQVNRAKVLPSPSIQERAVSGLSTMPDNRRDPRRQVQFRSEDEEFEMNGSQIGLFDAHTDTIQDVDRSINNLQIGSKRKSAVNITGVNNSAINNSGVANTKQLTGMAATGSIGSMLAPVLDVDPGLQSNFATVYNNEMLDKEKPEAQHKGTEISEKLLGYYEENYMKKFPFQKGQFHQCIPNPYKPNEFITVMLVERSLEHAGVDKSVHAAFRATQGRVQSLTYEEYKIVDPHEADDEGDLGEGEGEEKESLKPDDQAEAESKPKTGAAKYGLFHEQNLFEHVDEIQGIENKEFARLKKKTENEERVDEQNMAVIGFWKLNKTQNFRCYHYFLVPLPMVRQVMDVEGTDLNQVLFVGNMHGPEQPGDVFMFYQNKDDPENEAMMLAILDPDCHISQSHLVTLNCQVTQLKKGSLIEDYILTMNEQTLEQQRLAPNPTMVKLSDDTKCIVFTAFKRLAKASQEVQNHDELNKISKSSYPTIFFHQVQENTIIWEIFGGEIFIDAVPTQDPAKPFDIYYLTNEIWQIVEKRALNEMTHEEYLQQYYNDNDWYINVIKYGVNPIDLDVRKKKAPLVETTKQYKLAFSQNKNFEIAEDSKVVEAYLHNDHKRCTLLFRGLGTYTFQLKKAKPLKNEAKYDLQILNKWVSCDLSFEVNMDSKNDRKSGFRIKGTGLNNKKEFNVKSEYYEFDQSFLCDWSDSLFTIDGEISNLNFKQFMIDRSDNSVFGTGTYENGVKFAIKGGITPQKDGKRFPSIQFEMVHERGMAQYSGYVDLFRGTIEGSYKETIQGQEGSGIFKIQQAFKQTRIILKMSLEYAKGESENISSEMEINLAEMEFKSKDDEGLHFISVEHLDNAQLKYFINERDTVFVRHGKDAYVQAKLVGIEAEDQTGNGEGYVESELFLYKVSESKAIKKSSILKRNKNKKKQMEPSKTVLKFYLNQTFERSQGAKDEQLWQSMPLGISSSGEVIGSVIFEEYGSDELILEFFTAQLQQQDSDAMDFSQRPLAQTFIVDYPLLAYKNYTPDNHEICIVHMAMDIPQKVINLGEWEFVSFVNHTQMVEQKVFNFDKESNCDIMFLVERKGKIRLMSFKSNPWLRKDEFPNKNDTTLYKWSLFLFSGVLARPQLQQGNLKEKNNDQQPKQSAAAAILNLVAQNDQTGDFMNKATSRRYDSDKIQNVQLITDIYGNLVQFMMVIQYNDSVATASLNDKTNFVEQCGSQAMLRQHLIRGYTDRIFYAESTGNAEKIFQLNLHSNKPETVVKKEVFQLAGSWIAAFEPDCENIQNDTDTNETIKESLYILDDNMKIYHLEDEDDIKMKVKRVIDFSESKKLKQVYKLRETDWSHVQITGRAITFDGDTYNLNSHHTHSLTIPKLFFGERRERVQQDPQEEFETSEQEQELDIEDNASEKDIKDWQIQSVQSIPLTTSMLATCQRDHKDFCFVVKPSPGSRKSDIVGFQQISEIHEMHFVSNQHILVRFRGGKTVTLKSNGTIVDQAQRVQSVLDKETASIVTQTNVEFGRMFLTMFDSEEKDLIVIVFGSDGKGEVVGTFKASKRVIKNEIQQDESIRRLGEKWGMLQQGLKKQAKDDEDEDIQVSYNEQVANSLLFSKRHLFQNELVKIGAIVLDDTTATSYGGSEANKLLEEQQDDEATSDKKVTRKVRFKVYSIDNRITKDQKTRSSGVRNFEGDMMHKVIVFACKTEREQRRIIEETDFCLVGSRLVQRHKKDLKLWITNLDVDELNQIHATPKGSAMIEVRQVSIDISDMVRTRDFNHVIIEPVPKSSHLYIKSNVPDPDTNHMTYYKDLLQVTVRNFGIIYDLDVVPSKSRFNIRARLSGQKKLFDIIKGEMQNQREVTFLQNMGQFVNPDNFVNTGFNLGISYEDQDEEGDILIIRPRIKFNEVMNLCFEYKSERWSTEDIDSIQSKVSGMVFRTYSELDLYELKEINTQLSENQGKMPNIDKEAILSIYEGRTIFSIYFDNIAVYEQLHSQLTQMEFEQEENINGIEIENSFLRRLLQVLRLPVNDLRREDEKNQDEGEFLSFFTKCGQMCFRFLTGLRYDQTVGALGFKSILQKSIHYEHNARYKEILMEIATRCQENTIENFVCNIDDISILFDELSPAIQDFFQHGFIETERTDKVKNSDFDFLVIKRMQVNLDVIC